MSLWRPHTTGILIGGMLAVILAAAIGFMLTHFEPKTEVRLGSGMFNARVASDEPARVQGLSGVAEMGQNEALLMIFDTDDKWQIWMKDMKISLDIVWLDKSKKVVHIVKNASPELSTDTTFTPKEKARYVVELPAGSVQKYSIKIGETALFENVEGEN